MKRIILITLILSIVFLCFAGQGASDIALSSIQVVNDRIRSTPAVNPKAGVGDERFYVTTFGVFAHDQTKYNGTSSTPIPDPTSGKLLTFGIRNDVNPPSWNFINPKTYDLDYHNNQSLNCYTQQNLNSFRNDTDFNRRVRFYSSRRDTLFKQRVESGTGFWASPVFYEQNGQKYLILLNKSGCLMKVDVSIDDEINILWTLNLRDQEVGSTYKYEFMATPVLYENTLYIAGLNKIHVVNISEETPQSNSITVPGLSADDYFEFPMIYDTNFSSDPYFYAVTHLGGVYSYNNGFVERVIDNDIGIITSPPIIDTDGNIIISAQDGNNYKIHYFNQQIKNETYVKDYEYYELPYSRNSKGVILSDFTKKLYISSDKNIFSLSRNYSYNGSSTNSTDFITDNNMSFGTFADDQRFFSNHSLLFADELANKSVIIGVSNKSSNNFSNDFKGYYPDTQNELTFDNVSIKLSYLRLDHNFESGNSYFKFDIKESTYHQSWGGLNSYLTNTEHNNVLFGDENGYIWSYPFKINSDIVDYSAINSLESPVVPYRGYSRFLSQQNNVIKYPINRKVNLLRNVYSSHAYLNGYKRAVNTSLFPGFYCYSFENLLSNKAYQATFHYVTDSTFFNINVKETNYEQNILLFDNLNVDSTTTLSYNPNIECNISEITVQANGTLILADNAHYMVNKIILKENSQIILSDNSLLEVNTVEVNGIYDPINFNTHALLSLVGTQKTGRLIAQTIKNYENSNWSRIKFIGEFANVCNYQIGSILGLCDIVFNNINIQIRNNASASIGNISNSLSTNVIIDDYVMIRDALNLGSGSTIKIKENANSLYGHLKLCMDQLDITETNFIMVGYNGVNPNKAKLSVDSGKILFKNQDYTKFSEIFGTIELNGQSQISIGRNYTLHLMPNSNLYLKGNVADEQGARVSVLGTEEFPGTLILHDNCNIFGSIGFNDSKKYKQGDVIETNEYGRIHGASGDRTLSHINIRTLTNERWDGIIINTEYPNMNDIFKLTNSNISGIKKILVKDINQAEFEYNTFTNCDYGIYLNERDMMEDIDVDFPLIIQNNTFKNCMNGVYFQKNRLSSPHNPPYLINVLIDNCEFGDIQGSQSNIYGITLRGVDQAIIKNCNFNYNTYGIYSLDSKIIVGGEGIANNFYNNQIAGIASHYRYANDSEIKNNFFSGELSTPTQRSGTGLWLMHSPTTVSQNWFNGLGGHGIFITDSANERLIQANQFANNNGSELIGDSQSLSLIKLGENVINDITGIDNGQINILDPMQNPENWDPYILANISLSVAEVYGNFYAQEPSLNTRRFYPDMDHFIFVNRDSGSIGALISLGLNQFYQEEYDLSIETMKSVIDTYPDSLQTEFAIQYLYLITQASNQDYESLRAYLDLKIPSETMPLYIKKERIKTNTFICEGDYPTAIQRLQLILDNPESIADSLLALVSQAYCYLNQNENNDKNIPDISLDNRHFNKYLDLMSQLGQINQLGIHQNSPKKLMISGNYPNPFNPSTRICFDVPKEGKVSLNIYNIKGQKVRSLVNESLSQGRHEVLWDGKDKYQNTVSSGIYFARIEQQGKSAVRKMMMIK